MATSKPGVDLDDFVNVWTDADVPSNNPLSDMYHQWVELSSARQAIPPVAGANALRKLYPKHSLVLTHGYGMNILGFPAASVKPVEDAQTITNLFFIPLARNTGVPGVLADQVEYGAFNVSWNGCDFLVYTIQYPSGFGSATQYFILHEGPEDYARLFLLSAGAWADSLHNEIWVFNQGFWQKDHGLWTEIQKADWKDVILNEDFKKALQKDVYGFFSSEAIYKELAIPWKRGLIMYGPPGNGKTISLKTIMKTCGDKGFAPLYVKSFQSYKGEEGAMADVFDKARQSAPCVVILEDLDSLINDRNRSFFLNQMDGLSNNDGLLIIGTTNHFDRLDPGLSTRPSRFDRKYKFDDPDEPARKLYVQYWQNKLAPNENIKFPESLVDKVVRLTDRFSFAYLKEAFVSSLVTLAGKDSDDNSTFESLLLGQIDILRKQLDKQYHKESGEHNISLRDHNLHYTPSHTEPPARPPRPDSSKEYDVHALLDALSESAPRSDIGRSRIYRTSADVNPATHGENSRTFRDLLDNLSGSLTLDQTPRRIFKADQAHQPGLPENDPQRRIRDLIDNISAENPHVQRLYSNGSFTSNAAPSGWPILGNPGKLPSASTGHPNNMPWK